MLVGVLVRVVIRGLVTVETLSEVVVDRGSLELVVRKTGTVVVLVRRQVEVTVLVFVGRSLRHADLSCSVEYLFNQDGSFGARLSTWGGGSVSSGIVTVW